MIKQAVLFVASTGLLVYFIMPVDDEKQSQQPTVEKEVKPKPAGKDDLAGSWEADTGYSEEEEEEAFVFGEPVTYSDDEYVSEQSTNSGQSSVSSTSYRQPATAKTPSYADAPRNDGTPKSGRPSKTGKVIDLTPPGAIRRP